MHETKPAAPLPVGAFSRISDARRQEPRDGQRRSTPLTSPSMEAAAANVRGFCSTFRQGGGGLVCDAPHGALTRPAPDERHLVLSRAAAAERPIRRRREENLQS